MKLDFNCTATMPVGGATSTLGHNEDLVTSYAELLNGHDEQVRQICIGPDTVAPPQ